MKPDRTKGSNLASEAGFCCLCQRPDEAHIDQRQQYCIASKILLPLPETRRSLPRSKAAISPLKQDFAASAEVPMKPAKTKGSNLASEAGFCCLCPRPDKPIKIKGSKHASGSKILMLPPKTRSNSSRPKEAISPQKL